MIAWIFLSVSNRMKELRSYIPDIKGKCADIDGVIVLPEYRGNHLQNMGYEIKTWYQKDGNIKRYIY